MAISDDKNRLFVDTENNKGITLWEVAQCLRDYRVSRLGRDVGILCTSPNINKWAKHKPVRFDTLDVNDDVWKASDGWCGLNIENALISNNTDVSGIENHYSEKTDNGWEYARPRGILQSEPFRLLDFNGYNHAVLPFVSGYTIPTTWVKNDGAFEVAFRLTATEDNDVDYLSYKDLPLKGFYLGLALLDGNGLVYRCTNINTIENAGFTLTFDAANVNIGNYVAYPFMSSRIMSVNDGGFYPAQVYTLPNCSAKTITIVAETLTIVITAYYSDTADAAGQYVLTYTIEVTNNSQAALTLENNVVRLRYASKGFFDVMESDEKSATLNNFTVNAGATYTRGGIFTGVSSNLKNSSKVWVSLQASYYLESAAPLQNIQPQS